MTYYMKHKVISLDLNAVGTKFISYKCLSPHSGSYHDRLFAVLCAKNVVMHPVFVLIHMEMVDLKWIIMTT